MNKSGEQAPLAPRHLSRRGLFRVFVTALREPPSSADLPAHLVPPGALPAEAFQKQCSRCYQCIDACPASVLSKHPDGLPWLLIEFASCDGCEKCIQSCPTGALRPQHRFDTGLRPTFSAACVNPVRRCRQCVESCPAQACSVDSQDRPVVNTDGCNGCGECLIQCPYGAIALS